MFHHPLPKPKGPAGSPAKGSCCKKEILLDALIRALKKRQALGKSKLIVWLCFYLLFATEAGGKKPFCWGGVNLAQRQDTASLEVPRGKEDFQGRILLVRRKIEEKLTPEQRDFFRKEFYPEQELKIFSHGSSNVLVVAPHGFPGDDDHTDYLAYFLAKELNASYLINNKLFYKPGRQHPTGRPANLNQPWSSNPHTQKFVEILLEMVSAIGIRSQAAPLVLCIHGMSDANARRLCAGDFCLGAGYTAEEREQALAPGGGATASKEVIDGILQGLLKRGFSATDGVPQYCAKKAIPGYLKFMESSIGPTHAVQVEVRYLGLRDPANLVQTARELASVVRTLPVYKKKED